MTHKSLLALSLGTFALGMAEFGMMGILPYVATGLSITLAQAGHLISAYALGVCFGACFLIFAHRIPLKHILLGLAIMMALGNTLAALAPNQSFLLVARFLSGLPHGAYFGVGSIVATKLAPAGKSTQAVAVMVAGMTVANLLGVPLGTFVSQYISWRLVFALVAAVAVALWWALRRWIPDLASLPSSGLRDQFRFLGTPAPWLLLGATLLGNGGIFCWYSYVHPMLTQIAGFSENQAGGLMMLAGASMVAGNILGGQLSDRYTPGKVASILQLVGAAALLLIFFTAHIPALAVIWMCVCTFCLFAVSSPQQLLLLRYSPGGALLGAAAVQMAFNLGNALGAYNGGLAISHHWGLPYTALIGVPMALAGFVCLAYFHRHWELIPRRQAAQPKDAS